MPVSESHVLVGVHTFRREEYLVGPSFLKCRLWVMERTRSRALARECAARGAEQVARMALTN
jgi:hypothetical protein